MQAWLGWPNAPSVKKKPKRVGLLAQAHALGMSFFFFKGQTTYHPPLIFLTNKKGYV
jgi:hypothetical protein